MAPDSMLTLSAPGGAMPKLELVEPPSASAPPALASLPAEILARYEIVAFLGRGGAGTVYRARDRRLDRQVALKLLVDHHGGDIDQRLLREARSQARLEHENACKVYEVG